MADIVSVIISGDREIEDRFNTFPQAARGALLQRITGFTSELEGRIRGEVPKRTGKLAGEIVSRVTESENRISGVVTLSGDYAKAGALEYGGTGKPFKVKAHPMRLDHLWGRIAGAMVVDVPQHMRAFDTPGRRFMRGPLDAMRSEIIEGLQQAVDEAAQQ